MVSAEEPPRRFVLAHGLFVGNLASWYLSCAHQLSAWGEVLMYDLRGHGKSQHTREGYSLSSLAGDLEALLAHLGWTEGPLHLIGHSYGGRVLLHWGRSRANRVAQLTLVDAPLTRSALPALGLTQLTELVTDPMKLGALTDALPPPLQLALKTEGRRARRALEGWWRLLAESSLPHALSGEAEVSATELNELSGRLWAIYGERSPCRLSLETLSEVVASERIAIIPNAGHYLLNEAPDAVCRLLIMALQGGSGG